MPSANRIASRPAMFGNDVTRELCRRIALRARLEQQPCGRIRRRGRRARGAQARRSDRSGLRFTERYGELGLRPAPRPIRRGGGRYDRKSSGPDPSGDRDRRVGRPEDIFARSRADRCQSTGIRRTSERVERRMLSPVGPEACENRAAARSPGPGARPPNWLQLGRGPRRQQCSAERPLSL